MKRRLGSWIISPLAGFEPATLWSEVGSANRSAYYQFGFQTFLQVDFDKYNSRFNCIFHLFYNTEAQIFRNRVKSPYNIWAMSAI